MFAALLIAFAPAVLIAAQADPPGVAPAPVERRTIYVNPNLVPLVKQLLYDPAEGRRQEAAQALAEVGDYTCKPALEWSVANDAEGVKQQARRALEKIAGRAAPPVPAARRADPSALYDPALMPGVPPSSYYPPSAYFAPTPSYYYYPAPAYYYYSYAPTYFYRPFGFSGSFFYGRPSFSFGFHFGRRCW
jgi:hypothetical protein